MAKPDDPLKWLWLGYETYRHAGARVIAEAMGLVPPNGSFGVAAQRHLGASDRIFPPKTPTSRAPAQCPPAAPRNQSGWRPYIGDPNAFHCGFEGYLENREPSPDWPVGECFYDGWWMRDIPIQAAGGGIANNAWKAGWESQRYFEDEERRLREKLERPYWHQRFRQQGSGMSTPKP